MKNILLGATIATMALSLALNIAQYTGKLGSPDLVKLAPTEQEQLAAIYGGM